MNRKSFLYFDFIMASFVAVLLISNIASTKIVQVGPLTFDGGTVLFPLAYIFGDVLTEVYGYSRGRRVIWTGFIWIAIAALVFTVIDKMQPAPGWELQDAFSAILGQTPRIVLGSMLAFWAGEFVNSYVLAKMKVATKGRWLWTRTIASTLFGEGVDTVVFLLVAFWGVLPIELLISIAISNYIFKVGIEVLFTPATYGIVGFLKRKENEDYYDVDTDFNPFVLTEDKGA